MAMSLVAAERTHSIIRLHNDNVTAAEAQVMDMLDIGVGQFEAVIASVRAALSTLSVLPGLADHVITSEQTEESDAGPADYCRILHKVRETSPAIEALSIAASDGRVACHTWPGGTGLDVSSRVYFRIAMRGIPSLESVLMSFMTGRPTVYVTQPVATETGSISSVLIARIDLNDLLPRSFLDALGRYAQVILVSPEGALISSHPQELAEPGADLSANEAVAASLSRTRGTLITLGPDGIRRIYGYNRLPGTNLHLLVGVDQAAAMNSAMQSSLSAGFALLILSLIILITLGIAGDRLIVAPVRELADRLVRFGRGDNEQGHTSRTMIVELQPLVKAFEHMADELTRREKALRSANQRLNSLASLDALTGIANRRSFDAMLAMRWTTASRLALLMIDIDNFKPYNDIYGHKEGDECIRMVAQILTTMVRENDLVARLGGEEFAVLMPETGIEEAEQAAKRLRKGIAMREIPHTGGTAGIVTVSIGCAACIPGPGVTSSDLMIAADRALYIAKSAGRNKVRSAENIDAGANNRF